MKWKIILAFIIILVIVSSIIGAWFLSSPARFAVERQNEKSNFSYIQVSDRTLEKFPHIKQSMEKTEKLLVITHDDLGNEYRQYSPIHRAVDIPNSVAWQLFDELGIDKRFPGSNLSDLLGTRTPFHLQYEEKFYYALIEFCLEPCRDFA